MARNIPPCQKLKPNTTNQRIFTQTPVNYEKFNLHTVLNKLCFFCILQKNKTHKKHGKHFMGIKSNINRF